MSLNKPQLIQSLIALFNKPKTESNIEIAAQELADAIEQYVKSGTVTGVCPPNGGALTQGKLT
ncbi:hypothetical protein [Chryseobacterium lathyri]|uniref:Uncharacterized protein n=1 Tax=Chryseobacterium lathyri TaxID=395933 RepID=A0A511Y8R1_9FLAO|nr:hypothetical protein [Chryseobacterium lathyri]GEN71573.1 hypothetical protein CLA01_16450 [Chryseobacterium lathyri]